MHVRVLVCVHVFVCVHVYVCCCCYAVSAEVYCPHNVAGNQLSPVLREARVWSQMEKGFNSGWVLMACRSNIASCYPMQPWGLGYSYQCVEGYEDPPHCT